MTGRDFFVLRNSVSIPSPNKTCCYQERSSSVCWWMWFPVIIMKSFHSLIHALREFIEPLYPKNGKKIHTVQIVQIKTVKSINRILELSEIWQENGVNDCLKYKHCWGLSSSFRKNSHTHCFAPHQSCSVVLFDKRLQLCPDWQVGTHPFYMTPVTGTKQIIKMRMN